MLNDLKKYIEEDDINKALQLIIDNDAEYADNIDYQNMKAVCFIRIKEYELAKEVLDNIIKIDQENDAAHYNLGYLYEIEGNIVEAAIEYAYCRKYTRDKKLKDEISGLFCNDDKLNQIMDIINNDANEVFIILSSCGWGKVLQRMHHISRALNRLNQKVKYICPAVDLQNSSELRKFYEQDESIIREILIQNCIKQKQDIDGIEVYTPLRLGNKINTYVEICQKIINDNCDKCVHIVSYLPVHMEIINQLRGSFDVIYECVDDHCDTEYAFWANKSDHIFEERLMECSKGITTTSLALYLKHACIEGRDNVFLSRNAFMYKDFIANSEDTIPDDIKNIPEPRVVYTGAIFEWFNIELFNKVVELNPGISFVIIGFGKQELLNLNAKNIYFLGAKEHGELKNYLRCCQVAIIPFKDDIDIIINCDPIKHYEYIACDLPVVTTYLPECMIGKPNTYCENDPLRFSARIEQCIKEGKKECPRNFVIANSWYDRASILYEIAIGKLSNNLKSAEIADIKKQLEEGLSEKNNGIGLALLSKCDYILNIEESNSTAKRAYEVDGSKFVETNYIAMCNNYAKLDKLIHESKYIANELKQEYRYRYSRKEYRILDALKNLIIINDKKFLLIAKTLQRNEARLLLLYYYRSLKNKSEICQEIIELGNSKEKTSPLFKYIKSQCENIYESKKEVNPFISVIVPTRNAASTLEYTLKTCIEQEYDNYEIIVSDNSEAGNEETYNLIKKINSPLIKYFRTDGTLEMSENYEFGYSKSSGEYVMVIGSDDGILLHGLKSLGEIIVEKDRPLSITWDMAAYGWPNCDSEYMKNTLFINNLIEKKNIKYSYYNSQVLGNILRGEVRYCILPMLYCNSIVSRKLIERAKDIFGKVFLYEPPDVYTGIVFSMLQENYLRINLPITIGGTSGNSGLAKINKEKTEVFWNRLSKKLGFERINYNVWFEFEFTSVVIIMECLKDRITGFEQLLKEHMKYYFAVCAQNLYHDDEFEQRKQTLMECINNYGDKEIISWFKEKYVDNKGFNGYPIVDASKVKYGYKNNGLILKCDDFGYDNVYDAARLYKNILGY